MKKRIIVIMVLAMLAGASFYISTFRLTDIQVSGCNVVDEQIIIDAVRDTGYAKNTIWLYLGNKIKPIESIPFVAKIDIEYISKNKVAVTVYEKSIAGCVEYMDSYVFFDKDGIVLDSAPETIDGIPCIQGMEFSEWEKGSSLPVKDESKFQSILTITQLIEKYKLDIDGIKFTAENEMILMHGNITIELGEGEYLAVQMMNLGSILDRLSGMEGTLYMKDFNSDHATASFSKK
ncbi:MAG: FtsQ-type POTRA domain-containing protein [Clostridium sp.]|nr:FtsQ-type POTRA domain-containing protein [Clostridium sp.]MCM1208152.1 FtsQ-type POTRA domain-containing protein [Ruminococcus sp.]